MKKFWIVKSTFEVDDDKFENDWFLFLNRKDAEKWCRERTLDSRDAGIEIFKRHVPDRLKNCVYWTPFLVRLL